MPSIESLRNIEDAKEFAAGLPPVDASVALNCAQPTCKPAPCRGCRPTCSCRIAGEEVAPADSGK